MNNDIKLLEEGEMEPLIKNNSIKILFNSSNKDITTLLVSILTKTPYDNLKDKIKFSPLANNNTNLEQKTTERDVVLEINTDTKSYILITEFNYFRRDIENVLNDKKFWGFCLDKLDKLKRKCIAKSSYYLYRTFGTQLKVNESYFDAKNVVLFDINTFAINSNAKNCMIDYVMYDIENKDIFSEDVKRYALDVANCYRKWYNHKYQECNSEEKNLILLGAMLASKKLSEVFKCIDELDTCIDLKKRLKGVIIEMLDTNTVTANIFDRDKEAEEMKKIIFDFANSETVKNAQANGMLIGEEKKEKNTIINSYNLNIPITTIAEICGTSIEKVKKVINDYLKQTNPNLN